MIGDYFARIQTSNENIDILINYLKSENKYDHKLSYYTDSKGMCSMDIDTVLFDYFQIKDAGGIEQRILQVVKVLINELNIYFELVLRS